MNRACPLPDTLSKRCIVQGEGCWQRSTVSHGVCSHWPILYSLSNSLKNQSSCHTPICSITTLSLNTRPPQHNNTPPSVPSPMAFRSLKALSAPVRCCYPNNTQSNSSLPGGGHDSLSLHSSMNGLGCQVNNNSAMVVVSSYGHCKKGWGGRCHLEDAFL